MVHRILSLPKTGSFFLFGPRQTGKTTLVDSIFRDNVWKVDLLQNENFFQFYKDPSLFRKQAEEKINRESITTVFVDEIQRVPALLTEIHQLIEKFKNCRFILTGSSARKLRRHGTDLLAGRAVERRLFPYCYEEISADFSLDDALRFGTLPPVAGIPPEQKQDILNAYVHTYLKEEIQAEGISRNLGNFSRFLDVVASQNGELINFSAIGRDCGVSTRTVQSYFEILEDTLLGFRLEPWERSVRKRLAGHPKFYLFDTGVTNAINRRLTAGIDPQWRGRLFEHFIVLETYRMLHYSRSEARLFFWRTSAGAEVDIIFEKHGMIAWAAEIKSSPSINGADTSGLRSFREEFPDALCTIVSPVENAFELSGIRILPWKQYLAELRSWLT